MAQTDVDKTIAALNKKFGGGSVQRLGENFTDYSIRTVSTGSLLLDLALGRGGLPVGRIVELYGQQSSGKTSIALFHTSQVQKTGRLAAFIDMEQALDPDLAVSYGVNVDDLYVSQPSTGEEALEVAESLARTGDFGIIVIDSVSSLLPEAEAEAEMAQQSIGLQARLMSKAMRKLAPVAAENNCTIVFINQIREKVGVMYGNPETTSGGRALAFYSSVRIEVRQDGGASGQIKDRSGNVIGHKVKCKIVKNKTATPYKEAVFSLMYGQGIDRIEEVSSVAVIAGMIRQGGAWYTYGTEGDPGYFKIQGKESLDQYLRDHPDLCEELARRIMEGDGRDEHQGN